MPEMPYLLTAMVTPFTEQYELDVPRARELARKLVQEGSDGLVVTGTTGESPTLSKEEKLALYEAVKEEVGEEVCVVAGTGGNNTAASVELTEAAENTGVDMIMAVVPYYNKPSAEGLYEHFKAIAQATKLPVILYNVPSRTGSNMSAKTVAQLARDVPNIVAVKEASGDMQQVADIRAQTPEEFVIYSGNDGDTLPILALGGRGVISVASHIVGRELREMIDSFHRGEAKRALELHLKLLPIFKACFVPGSPNPCPVKAALRMVGFDVGPPRLPLVEPNAEQKTAIRDALCAFGLEVCA